MSDHSPENQFNLLSKEARLQAKNDLIEHLEYKDQLNEKIKQEKTNAIKQLVDEIKSKLNMSIAL